MDDLLPEFLIEASENLAVIDVELVRFEQDPNDSAILQDIFRLVHTIKGTSGFLGLPRLESVAHAGEDVLGKFRDGDLEVTPAAVTLILRAIDTIKEILAGLEEHSAEPEGDDSELIAALGTLAEGEATPEAPAIAAPAASESPAAEAVTDGSPPVVSAEGFPVATELLEEFEAATANEAPPGGNVPVAESAGPQVSEEGFPVASELLEEFEAATAGEAPAAGAPAAAEAPAPASTEDLAASEAAGPKEPSIASQSIRVAVPVLENLMTLVGELVLTRNQLLQMVRGREDSEFEFPLQRLSHITTDLQEGVMKTRMQPIKNAWAKLPRIVRDLAMDSKKKIDLQMVGGDTELDRQVLDLIKDPLMHMVRNSADHGLENSEDRLAAGKPETGTITLHAYHEGGHIIIGIEDDGRGLNIDRIKDKILNSGLASESELAEMTDQQIHQFIFKAGFSTAEKVTNVSGRGVGMDVVRSNIEKIGGNIELKSVTGEGSKFTIKIPLTLAIVSALIVDAGGERFAIPQISVLELVRVTANSDLKLETINDTPVLRLRDSLLPLIDLKKLQQPDQEDGEPAESNASEAVETGSDEADAGAKMVAEGERLIVVSQVGSFTFGIIVDRVYDIEEIVVKPVAPILRKLAVYSGNTILGDGSVIMILDPNGIAATVGAIDTSRDAGEDKNKDKDITAGERSSLLVFRGGGGELRAVPLALVSRLEALDASQIEYLHGKPMVQYRECLMPLIALENSEIKTEGQQSVLVFQDGSRAAGLAVEEIVDIVEEELKVEIHADHPGLVGTAVIDGRATDIIDTGYYLTQAYPDWFKATNALTNTGNERRRMLLVDDSPFFRNLMAPLFSVAGYDVTSVESVEDALSLRESGVKFDVIISDIEMPGQNGFEFAQNVRSDDRWREVPMVALTAHASDADKDKGREVGFNGHVAKFDRDILLETINETLNQNLSAISENAA
ncbi:MAG: hybrid sensor histidine kinase/response regulator [Alphaproteobacteria bacterium]|nr:hybrid sensor histidine kinase/response regulator [Alphaproteobacteria bacterium]